MLSVSLPKAPKFEEIEKNTGKFVIDGCYPGLGTTLANSLRRVLLSSLPGNAAVSVKIKGITHEFTTIKGVAEDAVQIMMNLKKVRFKLHGVEEATVFLKAKGEKEVTAKDFKTTSEVEVVNTEQKIATLTSPSAELELEVKVGRGLGYVPVEQQEREEKEIGTIAIDAVYTPIKRVNFLVDNMRVGKRTDFDRITLEIVTDGTISPEEAYAKAVETLMAQYNAISEISDGEEEAAEKVEIVEDGEASGKNVKKEEEEDATGTSVNELSLSTRTLNVLETNGIKNVSDIANMTEEDLRDLEGMGDKGVKEIKKGIGTFGITLKVNE